MMAALFMVGGVQATTVRKYLRLTDSDFSISYSGTNTLNAYSSEISYGENASVAWDRFYSATKFNLSEYNTMVVKLKETSTQDLKIVISEGGGFWDTVGDDKTKRKGYVATLAAGETELTLTLSGLEYNNDYTGEGSKIVDWSNIWMINLWNPGGAITFKFSEIYFEKTVDKDFLEIPMSTASVIDDTDNDVTRNGSMLTFGDGGDSYGWAFDSNQDWSGYKYLVIVPRTQFSEANGKDVKYIITDGTNTIDDYPFAYGYWQRRRAMVVNLTDHKMYWRSEETDNVEINATLQTTFGAMNFTMIRGLKAMAVEPCSYGISAVYLSNTKPTYVNNNNADGEIITLSDYSREFTEKDKWGTICLPYNAAICGADIYEVVGVDSKDSPSKLYLERKDGLMEAGKAYVFKTLLDNENTHKLASITCYRAGAEEVGAPSGANLIGTFTGATVPNDGTSYILKDGSWLKVVGTTNTVGANRAYLTLTDELVVPEAPAGARIMTLNFDEKITGIESSTVAERNDGAIYTLTGVQVKQPTRGIYVKNGKKYIVK